MKKTCQNDLKFYNMALVEREMTDDPKYFVNINSGVGAVIVLNGLPIAKSANLIPSKFSDKTGTDKYTVTNPERYHVIEHAERAAIFTALCNGEDISGATMYCTRFPCSDCARALVWVGIERLVVTSGPEKEGLWCSSQEAAEKLLHGAGVEIDLIEIKD